MPELPGKVKNRKYSDHGVREEEGGHVPVARQEYLVATYKRHDAGTGQRNVRDIGLTKALVRKGMARNALCNERFSESSVGEGHHGEVNQL